MPATPADRLTAYADLALEVGLNLQAGQRLILTVPVEAATLARVIAGRAYARGARLVDVHWTDDGLTLARFAHAPRDSFAEYPTWRAEAMVEAAQRGDAFLSVRGTDPQLLAGQDPQLVTTAQQTAARHSRDYLTYVTAHKVNWCVIAVPVAGWAQRVFPGADASTATARLWDAIAAACRLDRPDPVAAWQAHRQQLQARAQQLTRAAFAALRFRGPGTDLTVGLAPGHVWRGGGATTATGVDFTPNLPTEEVFSMPHRERVEGTVTASKPLNYGGTLIEGLRLRFVAGQVVEVHADAGQQVLQGLVDTDAGAARLGEVALVPASSPIARTGILFLNTLYDENAASHVALGRAYADCLQGGGAMRPDELAARGANDSLTHVDFMIGGPQMDVAGVGADGSETPVMTQGEWATPV